MTNVVFRSEATHGVRHPDLADFVYLILRAESDDKPPGGTYLGSISGYVEPKVAALVKAAPRMLAALRAISSNPHLNLGDQIYSIRERELQGFDGPAVKAWSDAVTEIQNILSELDK